MDLAIINTATTPVHFPFLLGPQQGVSHFTSRLFCILCLSRLLPIYKLVLDRKGKNFMIVIKDAFIHSYESERERERERKENNE